MSNSFYVPNDETTTTLFYEEHDNADGRPIFLAFTSGAHGVNVHNQRGYGIVMALGLNTDETVGSFDPMIAWPLLSPGSDLSLALEHRADEFLALVEYAIHTNQNIHFS